MSKRGSAEKSKKKIISNRGTHNGNNKSKQKSRCMVKLQGYKPKREDESKRESKRRIKFDCMRLKKKVKSKHGQEE